MICLPAASKISGNGAEENRSSAWTGVLEQIGIFRLIMRDGWIVRNTLAG
ncbi:hypothetical protein [Novosphingobium album (ex Hu et al. 2023)]|uniref:Uncharacterized protein n=1 Tax=Novosphingobium album (ex Hu et al. 2023) TaxID=2930093 RepID=A0ABT0B795_9SPHN|nr:hypothetical protein [Novosphingobium album (ex Hu et al. 2023)]MCJ2180952.1 hypothetical protein [Novosphingobium album (ex Hu et al. 2023)]